MIAYFEPFTLKGRIAAPPSKSMAHRYLIGAALCKKDCVLEKLEYSEDILATIDCLKALGVKFEQEEDSLYVKPQNFMKEISPKLSCRESGSTLRFMIPLTLCLGQEVMLKGSQGLLQRPLDVYEKLCEDNGFTFVKDREYIRLKGQLEIGHYRLRGDISSQFITGLIFALVYLGGQSTIEIIPPFESQSYVLLTIQALSAFGINVTLEENHFIQIKPSTAHHYFGPIEGDYSNAAFLEAYNYLGSEVMVDNLDRDSLQGDRVYRSYFEQLAKGCPTLDITDCPDLGPVLIAMASLQNGCTLIGTDRLKIKESNRGMAMDQELSKLGGALVFKENEIVVPKQNLSYQGIALEAHQDHRIVMALSLILSKLGGCITGVEAVSKSYPGFFEAIHSLGAKVKLL